MIYFANITTPKNTAIAALQKTSLRITGGLIYKVEFHFPSGSAGLMGIAVFDGLFQVWPSSIGQFFVSDNETISFDDLYLKETPPWELQIYTYNTDDTYDHVCDVRIGLVSSDIFIARFLPYKGYDYFVDTMEKLRAQQAEVEALQAELVKETAFEWLLRQGEVTD